MCCIPANLKIDSITTESESQEYSACTFLLNQKFIHFRKAKKTPKKLEPLFISTIN
ncbi:MAG: MepB family protein [Flavobacteriales bacterium]